MTSSRTVLAALFLSSVAAVACGSAPDSDGTVGTGASALSQATSIFEGGHAAQEIEGTWIDDQVCTLQSQGVNPKKFFLDGTSHPVTANPTALYLIAPIDPSSPQDEGPPAHDHVLPATYPGSANVEVTALLPGPNATGANLATRIDAETGLEMAYAADLGAGIVNLTSYAKVSAAIERGLVSAYPVGLSLVTVHSCR